MTATCGPSPTQSPRCPMATSFRDISTVVMINRRTGALAPLLSGQHAPHMLSNGNVLLFDNGPHRLDHSFPVSRVLEIDPATKEIVWKYQEVGCRISSVGTLSACR